METHVRKLITDEGLTIITCWFCPNQAIYYAEGGEEFPMKSVKIGPDKFVACNECIDSRGLTVGT